MHNAFVLIALVGRYKATSHLDKPFRKVGSIAWIVGVGSTFLNCIPHPV